MIFVASPTSTALQPEKSFLETALLIFLGSPPADPGIVLTIIAFESLHLKVLHNGCCSSILPDTLGDDSSY